ncbi:hypothetical protein EPN18_04425 [bacterium]|nr:MAG: hypothetical protein EPN18_04425 [bacterium]
MPKNTLPVIIYLFVAITIGIMVTLVTGNLDNMAEEKRLKKSVEMEVRNAVSSFKDSAPVATQDDVIRFLKEFTRTAMKNKLVAVEHGEGRRPNADDYVFLLKITEGKKRVDLYISAAFLDDEVSSVDIPDFIPGVVTTLIVFGLIMFYTEKRRQLAIKQDELVQALKEHEALALLGRMTATLAHELKTPIATISNLVQVLPARLDDTAFTRRFSVIVGDELTRTQQLIDNLLIYGKDITSTSHEMIELQPFILELSRKHGLRLAKCPDVSIEGDKFYLRLLFENLMRNSLQAGANEAVVRMTEQKGSEGAVSEIFFEDNGSGFKQETDLDALLSPFVTMRSKGAGLGLYLAHKIAVAHGGGLSLYRLPAGAGVRIFLQGRKVHSDETMA